MENLLGHRLFRKRPASGIIYEATDFSEFLKGEPFMIRAALGVLKWLSPQLLDLPFENVMVMRFFFLATFICICTYIHVCV